MSDSTHREAAAQCSSQLEGAVIHTTTSPLPWPEGAHPCICTSGARDRPLASCPHCHGEGWVR